MPFFEMASPGSASNFCTVLGCSTVLQYIHLPFKRSINKGERWSGHGDGRLVRHRTAQLQTPRQPGQAPLQKASSMSSGSWLNTYA